MATCFCFEHNTISWCPEFSLEPQSEVWMGCHWTTKLWLEKKTRAAAQWNFPQNCKRVVTHVLSWQSDGPRVGNTDDNNTVQKKFQLCERKASLPRSLWEPIKLMVSFLLLLLILLMFPNLYMGKLRVENRVDRGHTCLSCSTLLFPPSGIWFPPMERLYLRVCEVPFRDDSWLISDAISRQRELYQERFGQALVSGREVSLVMLKEREEKGWVTLIFPHWYFFLIRRKVYPPGEH